MKRSAVSFIPFFIAFLTCGNTFAGSAITVKELHESIEVGSYVRTYALYRPSGWDTLRKMPMLLALHGLGGDADGMERLTGFEAIAEREKFLLVYPEGLNRQWNDGRGRNPFVNDVNFIDALIGFLASEYKIDSNRVYVAGMSNGGFMTMKLACESSRKIAAVASVAATIDSVVEMNCGNKTPISVVIIQGTKDKLVPIDGGVVKRLPNSVILSHDKTINCFVKRDGCQAEPSITNISDRSHDGTSIIKSVFANGANGAEVIGYVVNNGGHTWPGGLQYFPVSLIGKTTQNLNASEVIWEFFKRHEKKSPW